MIALHPESASLVKLPSHRQKAPVIRLNEARSAGITPSYSAAAIRAMSGLAILDVTPSGAIEFATDKALSLLEKYFPSPIQLFSQRLPEVLIHWLSQRSDDADHCPAPGVFGYDTEQLRVHITGREDGNFQILLDERSDIRTMERLTALGLTPKEAEVLLWISRGKTDGDIATILGCKPRTVNKHSEQIRAKLGVETRTAAAAVAMELIGLSV